MKISNVAILAASACAALVAASPTLAAEPDSAASVASSASLASAPKPATDRSKIKYCVKHAANTGTRLSPRQCRTKAEWDALGLDTSSMK